MSKTTNETLSNSQEIMPAESGIQYQIKGKTFVVQPVFQEDALETVGSVLLRLMKAELARPQT